uniref:TonB-dependent siderophore receptor n=2 Tax=Paracidobacterium acidisoli TaxID=2303751 RepID=A0A372IKG6_9BACT
MGTIAAWTAVGGGKAVLAQTAPQSGKSGGSQAQLPVRRFDIAAGPLDQALKQFGNECGVTVSYTLPQETVPGFRSQGVTGLYTEQQALKQLLSGTGLDFSIDNSGSVTIGLRSTQSVQVNAVAGDSIALSKFTGPLLDTPQAVNTISKDILADQGVSTFRDALRNSPGISLAAGEGALQGDNLTIRGFSAQDDIFLDGVRDFGSYYRDPFNYEQIDVLEGPAGVEFGRGSTGGVINQESKVAQLRPFMVFDAGLGTDLTRRFTGDINEPLPHIADGAAFRLNFMGNDSNVAQRDVTTNRRYGVAPTFAVGLNTPTRLIASALHQQEDDIPDYGIPWYFGHVAPVARQNYYGFKHDNYLRTNVDIGTIRLEHDVDGHGLLRNVARYAHYERKWQITEPQVNNASSGTITPQTPLDQVMVNRNQLQGISDEAELWDQADFTYTGKLLGIRQTAVIGAEGGRESSDPTRGRYVNPVTMLNTVPAASLLHPDEDQSFSGTLYPNTQNHTAAFSAATYLLDTFDFGPQWQLSGGIRLDHFDANVDTITWVYPKTGAPVGAPSYNNFEQDLNKGTWRAALVYKPKPNGSVYFDYGTSFDPSAESLSLTAATFAVPPEQNETYELGSKWDVNNGKVTVRGALFRTNRQNVLEPSPTDSSIDVLAGSQRVDGAEGVIQGHVTDRWELLTSYTFLHSETLNSPVTLKNYPAAIGLPLQNVPENMFNLWTEYRLPRGFEVGAGGNFVGKRDANSTTLTSLSSLETAPQYWTFNAMAKYDINDRIALQANVNNLTDRFYLDQLHPAHVVPGAGASADFGLKFKF